MVHLMAFGIDEHCGVMLASLVVRGNERCPTQTERYLRDNVVDARSKTGSILIRSIFCRYRACLLKVSQKLRSRRDGRWRDRVVSFERNPCDLTTDSLKLLFELSRSQVSIGVRRRCWFVVACVKDCLTIAMATSTAGVGGPVKCGIRDSPSCSEVLIPPQFSSTAAASITGPFGKRWGTSNTEWRAGIRRSSAATKDHLT